MQKNRGRPWGRLASFKGWKAKNPKSSPGRKSTLLFLSSQGKMFLFVSASCVQLPEGVKNFQKHRNFKTIIPSELISWKIPIPPPRKTKVAMTSNKKNLVSNCHTFPSKQMADFVTWLEAKALVGQKTYLCWTAAPQKFHFKVETWKSRAQPCGNAAQSSSQIPILPTSYSPYSQVRLQSPAPTIYWMFSLMCGNELAWNVGVKG